ncbi:tRNA (guanosine(37)-N1)-methyltransferase TrmD [Granulicella sp. L46]|uniref:tRNA (guanosine(37)-N1)-methyltransferase TrmD n=1 Tax=Granulicella sp. L46 TaxID=1641865 RepID=UPI00131DC22D|nr:tRNA (guanosine(37)-N1)-methyltransferase TrmD [Granulicella sp. L46]
MRFDILTIFPEFFGALPDQGILGHGVVSRALRTGLASAHIHDLRTFTHDRHRTVDDRPFGGGEGMVLKPQPIHEALEFLALTPKPTRDTARETVILLSAQGKRFTQSTARRLATLDRVVLLCGRYEGVDERVSQLFCDEELSIGDYVLSGGELAAAILLDATVRLLPGVLGHADSSRYESFGEGDPSAPNAGAPGPDSRTRAATEPNAAQLPPRSTNSSNGILDYPHYTRPADFLGLSIPDVLGNGDHLAIRRWRRQAALAKTLANRPDLLLTADLSDDDREYLASLGYCPPPDLP